MGSFKVCHGGEVFEFDRDLIVCLAVEQMERWQRRAEGVLSDLRGLAVGYLDEMGLLDFTRADVSGILDACARALASDRLTVKAIMQIKIDDSNWSGDIAPEIGRQARIQFAKAFPRLHNMIYAGLFDREAEGYLRDRLSGAGMDAAWVFHHYTYRRQRELFDAAVENGAFTAAREDMDGFYDAKIEEAITKMDSDGNRPLWS